MRTIIRLGMVLIVLGTLSLFIFGEPLTVFKDDAMVIESETISSPVSAIALDANAGSVVLKASADEDIHIFIGEDDASDLRVTLDDDHALTIRLNQTSVFGWPKFSLISKQTPLITLALPDDLYSAIDIRLDVGEITINDVRAQTLSARTHVGKLDLAAVETETASLNVDVGKIKVTEGTGGWHARASVGEIKLSLLQFEADVDAEVNLGSINMTLFEMPESYQVELETDLGEVQAEGLPAADVDTTQQWQTQVGTDGPRLNASVDVGQVTIDAQ